MSFSETLVFQILVVAGRIKRMLTKQDLRLSMVKKLEETPVVSDPEIYRKLREDPRFQRFVEALSSFSFHGSGAHT